MNLITASELLARLKVGPKEGLALGVIASLGGTAQSHHVMARLGHYSKDPSAILSVLRKKGLIKNTGQVRGSTPFWSLTATASIAIAKAKEGLSR